MLSLVFTAAIAASASSSASPAKVDESLCALCEVAVSYIDAFIAQDPNATEAQIETELVKVCALLGSEQEQCETFVKNEVPAIISYLEMMPADQVCTALKVCTPSRAAVSLQAPAKPTFVKHLPSTCSACNTVAKVALSNRKQGASAQAAIEGAMSVCALVAGNEAAYGTCMGIIDAISQVPDAVQAGVTSESLCAKAEVCEGELTGELCPMCTFAMSYVQEFLKSNGNATTQEVEDALKEVCKYSGEYAQECANFVDAYTPLALQYLESMTPAQVCAEIGVCTSAATAKDAATHGRPAAIGRAMRAGHRPHNKHA